MHRRTDDRLAIEATQAQFIRPPSNTANDAVPAEGKRVLIDKKCRFDGVHGSALGFRKLTN